MASLASTEAYLDFLRLGEAEGEDGFYAASLSHDQLLAATGVRLHKGRSSITVVSKATEDKLIVVEEDSYSSGKDAITRAMARYITEVSGMPVRSPVTAHSRMLKGVGGSSTGYIGYAISGSPQVKQATVELTLDSTGELDHKAGDYLANREYVIPSGVTYPALAEFLSGLHSSGVHSTAIVRGVASRTHSRLTGLFPPNFTLGAYEDSLVFGRRLASNEKLVPGPEDIRLVNDIVVALRALNRSFHNVIGVVDSAHGAIAPLDAKRAPNAGQHSGGRKLVPIKRVSTATAPSYRELNDRELSFVSELAAWGASVVDGSFYKKLDMGFIFGNRLRSNGRNVVRCLSERIKEWRSGVDLTEHPIEDTARIIAEILSSDAVTQRGPAVGEPIMAALVLMCREAQIYHIVNGCTVRDDGKHYPL